RGVVWSPLQGVWSGSVRAGCPGVKASGFLRTCAVHSLMSALHPKADMCSAASDVGYGPKADIICASLNQLIGNRKYAAGNGETERLGDFEIDYELEFTRLHDRQLAGLFTFENPSCVAANLAISICNAGAVTHQTAIHDKVPKRIARRQSMTGCQCDDLFPI